MENIRRIPLNLDYLPILERIQPEQAGLILVAVMKRYVYGEELNIQDPAIKMLAEVWCNDINISISYNEKKQKQYSERARKGGVAKAKKMQEHKEQEQGSMSADDDAPLADVEEVEQYPFEDFWNIFPNRINKKNAIEYWKRMSDTTRKEAIEGAKRYAEFIENKKQTERRPAMMSPTTFFADRRWEDEYEIPIERLNTNGNNFIYTTAAEAQRERNRQENLEFVRRAEARIRPYDEARARAEQDNPLF